MSADTLSAPAAPSKKGLGRFVGRRNTKTTPFMDDKVTIVKLTVEEVLLIQDMSNSEEFKTDPQSGISLIKKVIRIGCPEAADMTEADFLKLSMDDLTQLSDSILDFSGLKSQGK